jgi:hypothetical protein
MHSSLRNLLVGLIDYAGLFPPARLPLDQALRHYARYRREPDGWMLGRFVCPAGRLHELALFHEVLAAGPPFVFSVLGRGGGTTTEFLTGLQADLEAVATFRDHHGDRVVADVLEVKLPAEVLTGQKDAALGLFSAAAEVIYEVEKPSIPAVFYEVAFAGDWRSAVGAAVRGLAEDNARGTHAAHWVGGGKLRCGGLEAAAFPSSEQLAFAITACRDAGVPWKATAGLHHPVRRFDAALGVRMHGFLNVFGAGVLTHARQLAEGDVRRVLDEEDPRAFAFDDGGFRWRDFAVTADEVAAARHRAAVSFGSCSFDEPRDDLRALGLLS